MAYFPSLNPRDEDEEPAMWSIETPGLTDRDAAPDGFVHIVPRNDWFPHILSQKRCWCHPAVEEPDEDDPNCHPIAVHHSFDDRERYEKGAKLQ